MTFPIQITDQQFENSMFLLLIFDQDELRYVYIEDFAGFMFHITKNKKKDFCKSCLQCFSSKNAVTEHKKVCLKINSKRAVKLEKGRIKFRNH